MGSPGETTDLSDVTVQDVAAYAFFGENTKIEKIDKRKNVDKTIKIERDPFKQMLSRVSILANEKKRGVLLKTPLRCTTSRSRLF